MLCHKQIRKIAKEIAGAAYEQFAHEDVFYANYPKVDMFVKRHWKTYIPDARNSLIQIMAGNYSEVIKEEAFEIFVQDKTLQAVNNLQVQGSA